MSSFWSGWIIVLTLGTIIGMFWLLLGNRTRPGNDDAKTGHVYDGIEEFDHPLPMWWLYLLLKNSPKMKRHAAAVNVFFLHIVQLVTVRMPVATPASPICKIKTGYGAVHRIA